jgi:hypothetical protein
MKSTLIPFVTMMTLLFLLPTGCRKDDGGDVALPDDNFIKNFVDDSFFGKDNDAYNPAPVTENRSEKPIVTALKTYYVKNPDVAKKMEARYGYPIWTSILHAEDNEGEGMAISFAKKNQKRIECVMYVHQKKGALSLKFGGFERKKIKNLKRMQSPTKEKIQKIDDMTYEQAAIQVLHFEYASFQEVDCELTADLKNVSGISNGEVETRSCIHYFLFVWEGGEVIAAIYLDSSCTLDVHDGSGSNPFSSDGGSWSWDDPDDLPKPCNIMSDWDNVLLAITFEKTIWSWNSLDYVSYELGYYKATAKAYFSQCWPVEGTPWVNTGDYWSREGNISESSSASFIYTSKKDEKTQIAIINAKASVSYYAAASSSGFNVSIFKVGAGYSSGSAENNCTRSHSYDYYLTLGKK